MSTERRQGERRAEQHGDLGFGERRSGHDRRIDRRWSDEDVKAFGRDIDELVHKHRDRFKRLSSDGGIEDIIAGLAELLKFDLQQQDHDLIKSCLYGAIEHLREAGFAYYASFK